VERRYKIHRVFDNWTVIAQVGPVDVLRDVAGLEGTAIYAVWGDDPAAVNFPHIDAVGWLDGYMVDDKDTHWLRLRTNLPPEIYDAVFAIATMNGLPTRREAQHDQERAS
jgi:hypothetical protein